MHIALSLSFSPSFSVDRRGPSSDIPVCAYAPQCDVKAAVQKCATLFLLKAVPCEAHNRVSLMTYYYDECLENKILRKDVLASKDILKWSIAGINLITASA